MTQITQLVRMFIIASGNFNFAKRSFILSHGLRCVCVYVCVCVCVCVCVWPLSLATGNNTCANYTPVLRDKFKTLF